MTNKEAIEILQEEHNYCQEPHYILAAIQMGISALKLSEWISVKDRLPEDEKSVLAYYGFYRDDDELGARFIGTLTYFCFDQKPHWQHESTGLFVTHWMPLPEPPADD